MGINCLFRIIAMVFQTMTPFVFEESKISELLSSRKTKEFKIPTLFESSKSCVAKYIELLDVQKQFLPNILQNDLDEYLSLRNQLQSNFDELTKLVGTLTDLKENYVDLQIRVEKLIQDDLEDDLKDIVNEY